MLDEYQKQPEGPRWIGPKMMAGAVAGLLLSLGLCGVGSALHFETGGSVLNTLGAGLFLLSCGVILLGVAVFIVELIITMARGR